MLAQLKVLLDLAQTNLGFVYLLLAFGLAVWFLARNVATKKDLEAYTSAWTATLDQTFKRWSDTMDRSTTAMQTAILESNREFRDDLRRTNERVNGMESCLLQLKGEHDALTKDCVAHHAP